MENTFPVYGDSAPGHVYEIHVETHPNPREKSRQWSTKLTSWLITWDQLLHIKESGEDEYDD